MDSVADIKRRIRAEVDAHGKGLAELALKIHANPEVGFAEVQACALLCRFLEENGFSVERGICGLPTAFRASYGSGRPVIALMAEYDALPGIGHACGHNIIGTAAVGGGVAARPAVDAFGGTVIVLGTPAEELGAGKVIMIEKDALEGVDAAMLAHPEARNVAINEMPALQPITVEYFGKEAHAGARPHEGINALEALIQAMNLINSLRHRLRQQGAVQGIITDGGKAANIVPGHSAGRFVVRAENDTLLDEVKQSVLSCFSAAAMASGARLEYRWETRLAAMNSNRTLARLFAQNMRSLGREMPLSQRVRSFASSDMGNVSEVVPAIHPMVAIARTGIRTHTAEFAVAAASESGMRGMLDSAAALALTAADLLSDGSMLARARDDFARWQKHGRG